ncbi:GNAT family N-acetyltransferase [Iamia sp. SCSIO 61187]|uniref:GNAT family N-acetyltransferase n=1 Tax=Iamia sp. SCSIO 61187 TaxID=2722752 RepID=UPI001C637AAF|nr:GNAT family N-acetyltransferase [Iamia sp. SCSIO 61187]QYG93098.1 GNAT family N-acetyltransferase [Iamia sp. SCSIO 61187]
MAFPLPAPPLVSAAVGLRLRPWTVDDAPALAEAWAVPDIAAQATVPGSGTEADARRWIEGAAARREVGLSLDLVVGPVDGADVWGEVGLAPLRLTAAGAARDEVEVGWWVRPPHRRRGVATAAAGLLTRWAGDDLGVPRLVARIGRGDTASAGVARAVGLARLGPLGADRDLWATARPPV